MSTGQKSNILYITNQCNLKCEYCYQLEDRQKSQPFEISTQEVNDFIDEIIAREGNAISTVVLFGGEPLLNKSKFFEILDLFEAKTTQTGKKFALSTTTNGIAFLDSAFLCEFKEHIAKLQNTFSLEISYDGRGQHRRSRAFDIDLVLDLFDPQEISIRYTIHSGNYKSCICDLIKLQKYKKIIINFYESELDLIVDITQFKAKLQRIAEYLYTKFKTPICYLNCELCRGCNFGLFGGINYNGKLSVDGNAGEFNHFTELGGLK